jgi:arylsulfatase
MGFTMSAALDLPRADVTGPVFASGGHLGGIALYLREGRPVFILRSLAGEKTELAAAQPLPAGKSNIGLTVTSPPGSPPNRAVTITADGRTLARGDLSFPIPQSFGISEVFGVGIDNGSTVLDGAEPDVPLAAGLSDVTFRLNLGR